MALSNFILNILFWIYYTAKISWSSWVLLRLGECGGIGRFGANPNFFKFETLRLSVNAKNSGWQIALISFVTFLHQGRKVSTNGKNHFFDF